MVPLTYLRIEKKEILATIFAKKYHFGTIGRRRGKHSGKRITKRNRNLNKFRPTRSGPSTSTTAPGATRRPGTGATGRRGDGTSRQQATGRRGDGTTGRRGNEATAQRDDGTTERRSNGATGTHAHGHARTHPTKPCLVAQPAARQPANQT